MMIVAESHLLRRLEADIFVCAVLNYYRTILWLCKYTWQSQTHNGDVLNKTFINSLRWARRGFSGYIVSFNETVKINSQESMFMAPIPFNVLFYSLASGPSRLMMIYMIICSLQQD